MKNILISLLFLFLISCSNENNNQATLDKTGKDFVVLALSLGEYDENYVDAYFGPENIRKEADELGLSLEKIKSKAEKNLKLLYSIEGESKELEYRKNFQINFYNSLISRIKFLNGMKMSFDQESKAFYCVKAPKFASKYYKDIVNELNSLLPNGNGTLAERLLAFKKRFVIPENKLDTVFKTAIQEAKARTIQSLVLPKGESFKMEFVKGKSWGAYNWFKGNSHSLIQINTEVPVYIDRPVELACHEGYPGHHVFHSTVEQEFVKNRKWLEFSVYPLFSPMSLISEGLANYGVSLAFPDDEMYKFTVTKLFPLAGLDTTDSKKYFKVVELIGKLNNASTDIARDYIDGKISKSEAKNLLINYKFQTPERADLNIEFFEIYRSYVINYTLGEMMIENYILHKTTKIQKNKWKEYYKLIKTPPLPKELLTNE